MAKQTTPDPNAAPKGSNEAGPRAPTVRPQPWWMVVMIVVTANFLLMRACFPEPTSITIPYTFFKQQVAAGNVEEVVGLGDSIRSCPPGSSPTRTSRTPPRTS